MISKIKAYQLASEAYGNEIPEDWLSYSKLQKIEWIEDNMSSSCENISNEVLLDMIESHGDSIYNAVSNDEFDVPDNKIVLVRTRRVQAVVNQVTYFSVDKDVWVKEVEEEGTNEDALESIQLKDDVQLDILSDDIDIVEVFMDHEKEVSEH